MTPGPIDWAGVKDKRWEAAGMEVYAAMVDRMDQGVGKIVAELKRTGQFDNTLILYLQDNGGCGGMQGREGREKHANICMAGGATRDEKELEGRERAQSRRGRN